MKHDMTMIKTASGTASTARERAIVMGGSMAGLAAARVLSSHFGEVVLVERDRFAQPSAHRSGVPQGRHLHGLLASGRDTLEEFFPGLFQEAIDAGGVPFDQVGDACRWFAGGEHARSESGITTLSLSRPLLEGIVRERVRRIPNVRFRDGCQVHGLIAAADNRAVAGIKTNDGTLRANLTVDATGRGSRSPVLLEEMGYGKPEEECIGVDITYATRRFRRSPRHLDGALFVVIAPTPLSRMGGVMAAQEGDTWTVTLFAYGGARVPTELASFVQFARTLPASRIHDVVSRAEAIGEGRAIHFPASIRRRYERMRRFPEGYLVLGDAVSSFNPIYGQGMSVAALEARELDRVLQLGSAGIASRFFGQVAKIVDVPWSTAAGNDLRLSGVTASRPAMARFLNWYLAKLHVAARQDSSLALAFQQVTNLLAPPQSLFRPAVIARVVSGALLHRAA